ncbi:sterol carrier family protein [Helcobacillus massiliensis]|uniref:Bacterial SCP orthologue domain-containing protein n=1 Tax=Helcobacillus massiliensis TaxID=521392 RepID=A0A839QW24_9MICO|nr:sterol carrier family protein [Helcobacillus massiliensis]MBB3023049.1 hypothetical protein [Helcobacillus massiliensis]WOO92371.1 sterol carrier family protein [Helcobacillus massiliensis]
MAPPRPIPIDTGTAALRSWLTERENATRTDRATAVRFTLQVLAEEHPGRSVELRVPPFGAVQLIAGTTHTRGTPPAVVEMPAETWLRLATGELSWADGCAPGGGITASGERSNLADVLPVPIARRTARAHAADTGAADAGRTDAGAADAAGEGPR